MKNLKHILKRTICLFLVSLFFLSGMTIPAFAVESWPDSVYVASEGACLMDADSKTVLFGKDEYGAYYPASITKVLTALVVLENCKNLSEQVIFSYDAVHIEEENSTIIGASEGDRLSVLDCLYCLLFQSANEVANALAEHVGAEHPELKEDGMSDRDVFVKMMNRKAEELGCKGSHFNNPSGLTDSNHYTTAYDMCLIMAAAIKNEQFLDIEKHTYWTHAPIARYPDANDPWNTVYPKHAMLKKTSSNYYAGTIAGKTGYTLNAGNTLVTAVARNGMTLVSCVLNAHANHYNDTIRLMNFGFDNFTSLNVSDYDNTNDDIRRDFSINGISVTDAYTVGIDRNTRITIPKAGSYAEVTKKLKIQKEGNTASAAMIYSYGDRSVGASEIRLMSMGGMAEYESAAKDDPLLAEILGVSNASPEPGTSERGKQKTGETGSNAAGTAADTASGADETVNNVAGNSDSEVSDTSDTAKSETAAERHKKAAETADIIGKAARLIGIAALLICAAAAVRVISDKRRKKKREQRRIEGMRRSDMLKNGDDGYIYQRRDRRLRKTKRKRKR